jgi:hypothetical protein
MTASFPILSNSLHPQFSRCYFFSTDRILLGWKTRENKASENVKPLNGAEFEHLEDLLDIWRGHVNVEKWNSS